MLAQFLTDGKLNLFLGEVVATSTTVAISNPLQPTSTSLAEYIKTGLLIDFINYKKPEKDVEHLSPDTDTAAAIVSVSSPEKIDGTAQTDFNPIYNSSSAHLSAPFSAPPSALLSASLSAPLFAPTPGPPPPPPPPPGGGPLPHPPPPGGGPPPPPPSGAAENLTPVNYAGDNIALKLLNDKLIFKNKTPGLKGGNIIVKNELPNKAKNKQLMELFMSKIIQNKKLNDIVVDIDDSGISDHFKNATNIEQHIKKLLASDVASKFIKTDPENLKNAEQTLNFTEDDIKAVDKTGLATRNGIEFDFFDLTPVNPHAKTDEERVSNFFYLNDEKFKNLQKQCIEIFSFQDQKITHELVNSFEILNTIKMEVEESVKKKQIIVNRFGALMTTDMFLNSLRDILIYQNTKRKNKKMIKLVNISSCVQNLKGDGQIRLFQIKFKTAVEKMIEIENQYKDLKIEQKDFLITKTDNTNSDFKIIMSEITKLREREKQLWDEIISVLQKFTEDLKTKFIKYFQSEFSLNPNLLQNYTFQNLNVENAFSFLNSLVEFIKLPWKKEGTSCGVMVVANNDVEVQLCKKNTGYQLKPQKLDKSIKANEKVCIDQNNQSNLELLYADKISLDDKSCP